MTCDTLLQVGAGTSHMVGSKRKAAFPSSNGAVPHTTDQLVGSLPKRRRKQTLSLIVGASVVEVAQTQELATLVAGQLARAAAIFCLDEVVVVDDSKAAAPGTVGRSAAFLSRILQFMETPQYLRRTLMPMHDDLRCVGQLPPLDLPHHMRESTWSPYREAVVVKSEAGHGCILQTGLKQSAYASLALSAQTRVTVHLGDASRPLPEAALEHARHLTGQQAAGADAWMAAEIVLPTQPLKKSGLYWGYSVRVAPDLPAALESCPWEGGYDLKLGTSERGTVQPAAELDLPAFKHACLAIGGPEGLEHAMPEGQQAQVASLFHRWLNTCPHQGSRTIRTEEAILISLAYLQPALAAS